MTAGTADLTIDAAAGFTAVFTYCNPIPGHPGDPGPPIDVTGWSAALTVRSSYGDGAALTIDSGALGGITVGTTNGRFVVTMTGEQTSQLPGRGVYDLLVTPPGSQPIRLVEGSITTTPAVTRAGA